MSQRFKVIIVEDEKLARNRLKKLLKEHEGVIEIIGEADNGQDGYLLANKERPDLIEALELMGHNGQENQQFVINNPTHFQEFRIIRKWFSNTS